MYWRFATFILFLSYACASDLDRLIESNQAGAIVTLEILTVQDKKLLEVSYYSSDGMLASCKRLLTSERELLSMPLIKINQSGDSIIIWQSFNPVTNQIYLEITTFIRELGWSNPKTISADEGSPEPGNYQVHLTENGTAMIYWFLLSEDALSKSPKTTFIKIQELFD
jgi:hypothetical protein